MKTEIELEVSKNAGKEHSTKTDMCNPRDALRLAWLCLWSWNGISNKLYSSIFSCYSFHNHLPQAFALDQRFAALEVREQRTVTFFITWES